MIKIIKLGDKFVKNLDWIECFCIQSINFFNNLKQLINKNIIFYIFF